MDSGLKSWLTNLKSHPIALQSSVPHTPTLSARTSSLGIKGDIPHGQRDTLEEHDRTLSAVVWTVSMGLLLIVHLTPLWG